MKERPILFSGEMVRAILDGRKTQTRRVVRLPPGYEHGEVYGYEGSHNGRHFLACDPGPSRAIPCPYGAPGDRLWVRETWAARGNDDGYPVDAAGNIAKWGPGVSLVYRADTRLGAYGADVLPDGGQWFNNWRPSIHMPRWASRLTLEIVSVRLERLQDITEADALAEGIRSTRLEIANMDVYHVEDWPTDRCGETARDMFRSMWDSINGKRAPWQSNPWVWVVTFRKL